MDCQRFASVRTLGVFAADLAAGVATFLLAYAIRFGLLPVEKGYDPGDYVYVLPIAVFLWMLARFWAGLHRSRQPIFSAKIFRRIVKCCLLSVLLIMSAIFFDKSLDLSRAVPPILLATGVIVMTLERALLALFFDWLQQSRGWGIDRVGLIGLSQTGAMTAARLKSHQSLQRVPVGFIAARDGGAEANPATFEGLPVLGQLDDLERIVTENQLTELFITDPDMEPREVADLLVDLEKRCLTARVVPNILEMMLAESYTDQVGGIPLLSMRESRLRGGNVALKWAFDVTVSLLLLLVFSLPMLLIAALIKLTSRGPLFYKQERVGLDGRTFNIYKFRSMRTDAEEASGPVMAKPGDARVTPIGRILRAWNLDELPQLFNVLAGNMSLVGPRPERPHFVDQFKEEFPSYMARHKMKAGITGWAQVNGLRGDTSIAERLEYDLYYLKHWSIWLDIKILFMTLRARENAY